MRGILLFASLGACDLDKSPAPEPTDTAAVYACDPEDLPSWYPDADGDGFGLTSAPHVACAPDEGEIGTPGDCDDEDAAVSPDADEVCDDHDNDCDGEVDEPEATDALEWFPDADGDGRGADGASWVSCEPPEGFVDRDGDCDDGDAGVEPGAQERCDGIDQDCDGEVDERAVDEQIYYQDLDGDGYGDPGETAEGCAPPEGYVENADDCDDADRETWPGAVETCDGEDEDCDGLVDDDPSDTMTWYPDLDEDGFGDGGSTATRESCEAPVSYTSDASDCDDGDAAVAPGATELCSSGEDEDCDGVSDPCALAGALRGATEKSRVGFALSAAGDLDGDGRDDLLVGAPGAGSGGAGAAIALLGPASGALSPSDAFSTWTGTRGEGAGHAVSGGVDLDGDGADDLAVGAPYSDRGADEGGAVFLVLGGQEGGALADADAILLASGAAEGAGEAVALCADLDGSGLGAVLAGSPGHDGAGEDAGAALLVAGVPEGSVSLGDADAVLLGEAAGDGAGEALSLGLDLDGDGIGDLAVGASRAAHESASKAGRVYLLLGPVSGSLSLADAEATLGGSEPSDRAGRALAAGDLDGDGLDNLVIGAPNADGEVSGAGAAWVLAGLPSSGLLEEHAMATLAGASAGGLAGQALAAPGDMNGDGAEDLVVGAPDEPLGGAAAGGAWILFGPFAGTHPLSEADARIAAEAAGDELGRALAGVGDTDGDGLGDLLVGSPKSDTPLDRAGAAFLVPGF